jgi:hypothetical protein
MAWKWLVLPAPIPGERTYVNRPVALLHVVGGEDVAHLGQLVEEVVLETEHRRRSHNGGLRVDFADDFLTPCLWIISTLILKCSLYMH